MDDKNYSHAPENKPGLHMVGFRIENLLALKGASYRLNIVNYIVPHFDGDVQTAAAAMKTPITVTVK